MYKSIWIRKSSTIQILKFESKWIESEPKLRNPTWFEGDNASFVKRVELSCQAVLAAVSWVGVESYHMFMESKSNLVKKT